MNVREAIALAAHVVGKGASSPLPILAYLRVQNGRIIATDLSQQIDIAAALPGLAGFLAGAFLYRRRHAPGRRHAAEALMAEKIVQPCPFCGDTDPAIDEVDTGVWAVVCNGCGCTGPIDSYKAAEQSAEQAIDQWNLRGARGTG